MKTKFLIFLQTFLLVANLAMPLYASAASPAAPYFELCVSPVTGGDCSGDGNGTLNKFYVGQTFDAKIMISTGAVDTKSANIIINYDTNYLTVNDSKPAVTGTQISAGTLYESYPDSGNTVAGGVIRLTGANTSGANYAGAGVFGTISFTVLAQKASSLSTTIDFTSGSTIDSNIVRSGDSQDILSSVENSNWQLLPDTDKPYVDSLNYADGAQNVPVESNITFHLKDDETGVNISTSNIFIQESGGANVNRNSWVTTSCSGLWATNDCLVTINPSDIGNRNWNYQTSYTVKIQDAQDKASANQSPAGPNTMDPVTFTFTTENDVDAPTLTNASPTGSAENIDTNISFQIKDVKTSVAVNGTHGVGINPSTISVDVTSQKGIHTYICGDTNTVCTGLTNNGLIWAYDVVINPSDNFSQSEQVLVTVKNVADNASPANVMANYNWSFFTEDTIGPTVDRWNPPKGANDISPYETISFHVSDTGVGVNLDTLSVVIGEDTYTLLGQNSFTYSGDASDYLIKIKPVNPFSADNPVAISINVADNAGNKLSPEDLYAVVYDVDPLSATCQPCEKCSPTASSSAECPATQTISELTENIISQFAQNPENLAKIRDKISQVDNDFKNKIEKNTLVLKINNRQIKNPEKQIVLFSGKPLIVSGTTASHANVSITIFSKSYEKKTVSDSQGKWNVKFDDAIADGPHMLLLNIEKNQANSGPIYGAKIYIIPIWLRIVLPIILLSLIGVVIYTRRKWKKLQNLS